MKAFGITAEYNPFHFGHEYLLKQIKADNPDSVVVAVMSGDFVQRGEAAAFDKFTRAAAACRSGVDLVIELPLRWSIAGAEDFASGAVGIFSGIGVKNICFGSECGNITPLRDAAELILENDFEDSVKSLMQKDRSLSYAAARSFMLSQKLEKDLEFFKQPNNILGIEYIKSALKSGSDFSFYTYARKGNAHDEIGDGPVLSASDIRSRFFSNGEIGEYVPENAALEYLNAVKRGKYLSRDNYNKALLTYLSLCDKDELAKGTYCGSELANSIYNALPQCNNINELVDIASSKTYTKAHIRRALLSGVFGIEKTKTVKPEIARILAVNENGRKYIRQIKDSSEIPMITKSADIKKLSDTAVSEFEKCVKAHDFYNLVCVNGENNYHCDWKKGPAML